MNIQRTCLYIMMNMKVKWSDVNWVRWVEEWKAWANVKNHKKQGKINLVDSITFLRILRWREIFQKIIIIFFVNLSFISRRALYSHQQWAPIYHFNLSMGKKWSLLYWNGLNASSAFSLCFLILSVWVSVCGCWKLT